MARSTEAKPRATSSATARTATPTQITSRPAPSESPVTTATNAAIPSGKRNRL
jgi:hypothetical protein